MRAASRDTGLLGPGPRGFLGPQEPAPASRWDLHALPAQSSPRWAWTCLHHPALPAPGGAPVSPLEKHQQLPATFQLPPSLPSCLPPSLPSPLPFPLPLSLPPTPPPPSPLPCPPAPVTTHAHALLHAPCHSQPTPHLHVAQDHSLPEPLLSLSGTELQSQQSWPSFGH